MHVQCSSDIGAVAGPAARDDRPSFDVQHKVNQLQRTLQHMKICRRRLGSAGTRLLRPRAQDLAMKLRSLREILGLHRELQCVQICIRTVGPDSADMHLMYPKAECLASKLRSLLAAYRARHDVSGPSVVCRRSDGEVDDAHEEQCNDQLCPFAIERKIFRLMDTLDNMETCRRRLGSVGTQQLRRKAKCLQRKLHRFRAKYMMACRPGCNVRLAPLSTWIHRRDMLAFVRPVMGWSHMCRHAKEHFRKEGFSWASALLCYRGGEVMKCRLLLQDRELLAKGKRLVLNEAGRYVPRPTVRFCVFCNSPVGRCPTSCYAESDKELYSNDYEAWWKSKLPGLSDAKQEFAEMCGALVARSDRDPIL